MAELFRDRLKKARTPERAAAELSREIGASGLSLTAYPLGSSSALLSVSVSCDSGSDPVTTWLYTFGRIGAVWQSVSSEKLVGEGVPVVLTVGLAVPRFAMLWVSEGMGHSIAVLEMRNLRLGIEYRISEMWDAVYVVGKGVSKLHWLRAPAHLEVEIEGPGMIAEEGVIDPDAKDPIVSVSKSPWMTAIDEGCGFLPGQFYCNGSVVEDMVTDVGHDVLVEVVAPISCSVVASALPLRWSEDRRIVVTAAPTHSGWRIVQVRPANRQCAIVGARVGGSMGPAIRSAIVPFSSAAYAVATMHDKYVVVARDGMTVVDGTRSRVVLPGGVVRDVALLYDGTPAWIDANGGVSTFRGGKVLLLEEDPDAMSLVGCGRGVCWTAYAAGEIRRWLDGKTTVLASGLTEPLGIASEGSDLVVAAADAIVVLPSGSSSVEEITPAVAPIDVAVNSGTLAWSEASGRVAVRRGGLRGWRDPTSGFVFAGGRPSSIALTSELLYWVDAQSGALRSLSYKHR